MSTLYIMCGVRSSEKSTLAKKIAERTNSTLISQDALWSEQEDEVQWRAGVRKSEEKIVKELQKGNSVVYDNTNLEFPYREILRNLASTSGANFKVMYVSSSNQNKTNKDFEDLTDREGILVFDEHSDPEEFVNNLL